MQLKRILLATDFSDTALNAVSYTRKFAAAFDARVAVVYADPFLPPPYFTGLQTEDLIGNLQDWKKGARLQLKTYAETHLPGLQAEVILMEKYPAEGILLAAENQDADLIIMGTHGRKGFNRMMMGSVAESVLRESKRPALIIRPGTKNEIAHPEIRDILCPINYTNVAHASMEYAAMLSQKFDARLTVVHVVESDLTKTLEQQELDRICEWIPSEMRSRCDVRELTGSGNAAEQVLRMADFTRSDLIVLGAQHKRFSDTTIIGTTTVRITRHSPYPVLVFVPQS